jgi:hypothetical protein
MISFLHYLKTTSYQIPKPDILDLQESLPYWILNMASVVILPVPFSMKHRMQILLAVTI